MNKELLEMLEKINQKKGEVKDLVSQGKLDEAEAAKEELKEMQKKFDILKDVLDAEAANVQNAATAQEPAHDNAAGSGVIRVDNPKDAIHDFAEAARHKFNINNEGTGIDGGYTVPEDIQTKINEYKEAKFSLETLVDVESVSTLSGRRTFQKRAQHTGFTLTAEAGAIQKKDGPQFEILEYTIKKYAGYLPVTNELLADSDANIANVLIKWIGEEDIATRNALILAAIAQNTEEDLANLDGIKKAINVTLGQAYAGSIKIITNDDGFNYLDTLKDENKQYLLKPELDPQSPIPYRLAVGARTIPVVVVPNNVLQTSENKAPFIIGDLKEGIKLFDRQRLTILSSNIAAAGDFNAYEQDMTLFRAIERLDVVVKDANAYINGTITVGE